MSNEQIYSQNDQQNDQQNNQQNDSSGNGCFILCIIVVLVFFLYGTCTRDSKRAELINSGIPVCSRCNGHGTLLQWRPVAGGKARIIPLPGYYNCSQCGGSGRSHIPW
jgi:hypothetical protein